MKGETKKILISSILEGQIQNELTSLHRFVCGLGTASEKLDYDEKIVRASVLWLKNNKVMSELVLPIKELLNQIEQRFKARSDMLLGIERHLKEASKKRTT